MIIIDIDQDFFFNPPLYDQDFHDDKKKLQKQVIKIKDFIKKYNLKGKQYTIFRDHHQAYTYIKNIGKIDKLLHFDAHHDFFGYSRDINKIEELHIGNWIGHLVKDNLCDNIDWIVNDKNIFNDGDPSYLNTVTKIYGNTYKETFYDYENHRWSKNIDYIIFTISPYFCPDITSIFIKYMN